MDCDYSYYSSSISIHSLNVGPYVGIVNKKKMFVLGIESWIFLLLFLERNANVLRIKTFCRRYDNDKNLVFASHINVWTCKLQLKVLTIKNNVDKQYKRRTQHIYCLSNLSSEVVLICLHLNSHWVQVLCRKVNWKWLYFYEQFFENGGFS